MDAGVFTKFQLVHKFSKFYNHILAMQFSSNSYKKRAATVVFI